MNKKFLLLSTILALSLLFSACSSDESEASEDEVRESRPPVEAEAEDVDIEAPEVEGPGIMGEFETQDLYGTTLTQDIFAEYDITMVNIWGTYCPPCIEEMPHLGELSTEYAENGVQIVGLVIDVLGMDGNVDETQKELAVDIIDSTGAHYTHILPSEEMNSLLSQTTAVPTTFFVDSEGRQVGMTYVGSRDKAGWIEAIESTLAEVSE